MVGQAERPGGWRRAARWAVAGVLGLGGAWFGAGQAAGQYPAPPKPIPLVVQASGEPGVYVVSGMNPPAQLPPVVPLNPVDPSAAPVASHPEPSTDGIPDGVAGCASGRCGHKSKCGPTCWGWLAMHWQCCKTPATVPPPHGANARTTFDMQRMNALAEYYVVYEEDWYVGTPHLNSSGIRHVDGIVRRFPYSGGAPVKVEPSGNAELDGLRRASAAEALVRFGVPPGEAHSRVVIGGTRAEGLRYDEVEAVYARGRIVGTAGYGGIGGYGSGGNGGFGGGGFGGGFPVFFGGVSR